MVGLVPRTFLPWARFPSKFYSLAAEFSSHVVRYAGEPNQEWGWGSAIRYHIDPCTDDPWWFPWQWEDASCQAVSIVGTGTSLNQILPWGCVHSGEGMCVCVCVHGWGDDIPVMMWLYFHRGVRKTPSSHFCLNSAMRYWWCVSEEGLQW